MPTNTGLCRIVLSLTISGPSVLGSLKTTGITVFTAQMLFQTLNKLNPIAQTAGLVESLFSFGDGKPTVTQEKYDELEFYFKYASSSYAMILPRPNGQTLVTILLDILTDSHGYIARDDTKHEIIVAFRGSVSPTNFIVDGLFKLVDVEGPYLTAPVGTKVHYGFQAAWKSVADKTMTTVREQIALYPTYSVVTVGHSLGGAMASLAGASLKQAHPTTTVRMYTYGQPRTGNAAYAALVTDLIGVTNIFRVVHSVDGVSTMVPSLMGFQHHGTEYWVLDPACPNKTHICNAAGPYAEDPKGSKRVPTTGINAAHLEYFGIFYMTPFFF